MTKKGTTQPGPLDPSFCQSNLSIANCSTYSRSDLVVFRNLFVTVFAILWRVFAVFYLLFLLFPGEMLQIRITDSGKSPMYHALLSAPERHRFRPHGDIVAWSNRNVNCFFVKFVRPSLISGRVGELVAILPVYHGLFAGRWANRKWTGEGYDTGKVKVHTGCSCVYL